MNNKRLVPFREHHFLTKSDNALGWVAYATYLQILRHLTGQECDSAAVAHAQRGRNSRSRKARYLVAPRMRKGVHGSRLRRRRSRVWWEALRRWPDSEMPMCSMSARPMSGASMAIKNNMLS
jgi:hypothetical protein